MKLNQKISDATLEQAQAWSDTQEQFTFCIDLLEISAHFRSADFWVDALETKFKQLLAEEALSDFNYVGSRHHY